MLNLELSTIDNNYKHVTNMICFQIFFWVLVDKMFLFIIINKLSQLMNFFNVLKLFILYHSRRNNSTSYSTVISTFLGSSLNRLKYCSLLFFCWMISNVFRNHFLGNFFLDILLFDFLVKLSFRVIGFLLSN
jgi:hypothetical protein